MRKKTVVTILVVTVLAAVAGYVATRARNLQPQGPDRIPDTGRQTPAPAADLKPAPDFDIILYEGVADSGSRTRLSQLWGKGRPVVVNFWAGLCPPCRAELPDFQRLYDERAEGRFMLIGVDIGPFIGLGTREEGKALLRELRITFPAGAALDARTVGAYQILGMPTTVFITAEGKIFKKHVGLLTRDQMDAFVAELVGASKPP
ncbi:MAG: TlpA family protein disulfide reductase [Armatimonadota bacterium]